MNENLEKLIKDALYEDIKTGDITTDAIVADSILGKAVILSKEQAVLAGLEVAESVFKYLDPGINFLSKSKDGDKIISGQVLAEINGKLAVILKGERLALNFLGRLSGIATLTSLYHKEIRGTNAKILDTRKTTPNLRYLEKYAVTKGGGQNHRMGLYDSFLIKENHILVAGGIVPAFNALKRYMNKHKIEFEIEIEVQNLAELQEVLKVKIHRILLDNMSLPLIKKAVNITKGLIPLEVSGGVTLDNIRQIAETDVDFISIGAITHSARNIDLSLLVTDSLN